MIEITGIYRTNVESAQVNAFESLAILTQEFKGVSADTPEDLAGILCDKFVATRIVPASLKNKGSFQPFKFIYEGAKSTSNLAFYQVLYNGLGCSYIQVSLNNA